MGAPFTLVPVAPLGASLGLLPVEGAARALHRYPPSPRGERLRLRRVALGLVLREAAPTLGLTPERLSDLEHGRAVLRSEAEWDRAEQALREAAGCGVDVMR